MKLVFFQESMHKNFRNNAIMLANALGAARFQLSVRFGEWSSKKPPKVDIGAMQFKGNSLPYHVLNIHRCLKDLFASQAPDTYESLELEENVKVKELHVIGHRHEGIMFHKMAGKTLKPALAKDAKIFSMGAHQLQVNLNNFLR